MKEAEVLVPDIGDFSSVDVIEVLVDVGDRVELEQSLITLESDKATMEIPSDKAGVVRQVLVKVGDAVAEGDPILRLEDAGDQVAEREQTKEQKTVLTETEDKAQARRPGEKAEQAPPLVVHADGEEGAGKTPHASPAIRRLARELGVDLAQVSGSGRKGRILREDVQGFVKSQLGESGAGQAGGALDLPQLPKVDFSRFGEIEEQPLGRIKQISGKHLSACWLNIPHVTQFDLADITELEAFRKAQQSAAAERDIKLTFLPFLMKACVGALQAMPEFNSSLAPGGDALILKRYYHIGVAVETPDGLMVPVIRDVDNKSIYQLAGELSEVSATAREGKLAPGQMQGGSFTVSSLGGIGGTAFTPIVNAPEVAILGVSRSSMQPVWNGKRFVPRLMLPLSLSYDHRVIDGAQAARFTSHLGRLLADMRRLLL